MNNLTEVWSKLLGSTESEYAYADTIAISDDGFIYTAITSHGDFNGITNKGNSDAHLIKYSSNGELLWSKELASTFYDDIFDIETDKNNNKKVNKINR